VLLLQLATVELMLFLSVALLGELKKVAPFRRDFRLLLSLALSNVNRGVVGSIAWLLLLFSAVKEFCTLVKI